MACKAMMDQAWTRILEERGKLETIMLSGAEVTRGTSFSTQKIILMACTKNVFLYNFDVIGTREEKTTTKNLLKARPMLSVGTTAGAGWLRPGVEKEG